MSVSWKESLRLLWRYLRPFRRRTLLLFLVILGGIGLQLVAPQVIRRFLDAAQASQPLPQLLTLALLFFLAVLGQKIVTLGSVYLGEDLGWAATNQLRLDLAAHCLRLDMGFHKLRTPGELIERVDGDVSTLAEYFSSLVVQVLGNGLLLLGVLVLVFNEAWAFGFIGLAYIVLSLTIQHLLQGPMVRVNQAIRQGYADMSGFLGERLAGTEDIRANGATLYTLNRLYPIMARITEKRMRADVLGGVSFASTYMLYILVLVGTLALAGSSYLRGEMSIGTVYLLLFYIGLLQAPLRDIRRRLLGFQQAMASIGRISEFFQIQPQVQERETAVSSLPAAPPSIRFDRVTFAYKDQLSMVNGQRPTGNEDSPPAPRPTQTVLHDLTFRLEAGKVLGLLGRTGSGKTTLTRLLFRLYDVDAGAITLGGVDVRHAALSDLRRRVGMVTQEVQLFAASVRDNLTLFRNYDPQSEPIADGRIIAAIEELGLADWFHALPDGLDTVLQSGGQGLSAGEAQLLAFTRVFLRDPQVVILDEASSRLDPATEQLLERAIDRLLQGRTAIVIAHRLATVQHADDILILENGRIVEHGPRIDLVADPQSRFAKLLRTGMEEVLA